MQKAPDGTNVLSTILMALAAGSIINPSSISSTIPVSNSVVYSAASSRAAKFGSTQSRPA